MMGPVQEGGRRAERLCDLLTTEKGDIDMTRGKTEELKGRVKEAAGALTGDAKLKREGQLDQAVGKVKQTAERIIDKAKDAVK